MQSTCVNYKDEKKKIVVLIISPKRIVIGEKMCRLGSNSGINLFLELHPVKIFFPPTNEKKKDA